MKRIIITGATGMIGATLANYSSQNGCEVLCIIRQGSYKERNIQQNKNIRIQYAALSDYETIDVESEYDVFYHFAWEKPFGAARDDVNSQLNNVSYTLDAVRLAKRLGCKVFVGAGSQAEFGITNSALRSDTPAAPLNAYGIAKYAAGKMSGLLCGQLGIRHNWVRVLSVYGYLDNPYSLIMYTINALQKGEKPSLSKCDQIWDYIYELDAARAFFAIGNKGMDKKYYSLGSGFCQPLKVYLETIKEVMGSNIELGFGEKDYYPNQPMYLCADISEIKTDTGWAPETTFIEGINKIIGKL